MTSAWSYYPGTPKPPVWKGGKQMCAANSSRLTKLKRFFLRLVLEGDLLCECAKNSSERDGVAII